MATRTALLNGNVINRDTDFSKHIEAVSEPWVISWFAVSSSSVAVWQALVKCERTNGDVIYAVVYNNSAQEISWNGDVFIEIAQELIDNWELMNEDWSEIAEIKVGTMPTKNALKLATKSWNAITDARNMIKKSGELLALINQNIEDISDLDDRVEALEEAGAIDHLEESAFVWETYSLSDILFKQFTPTLEKSTLDCKIWDISTNTQVHIQRIATWTAVNTLKLKVKKIWSPTTNLIVEVRKWTLVSNSYWYWWGDLVASWSIAYSDISSSYAEKTITLDNNFWWNKWELLSVVVYQENNTVNDSNYYVIACDNSQYSEALNYIKVNWSTRTKSLRMPYCVSNWFSDSALSKKGILADLWIQTSISNDSATVLYTATKSWEYKFTCSLYNSSSSWAHYMRLYLNWNQQNQVAYFSSWVQAGTVECEQIFEMKAWDILYWYADHWSYWSWNVSNMKLYSEKSPLESVPLRPVEVKNIGEIWYWVSYWNYPRDNKFYWWIIIWTNQKATTWNITLWNAVGFITVNLNGEIVKIPYYWN